MFHSELFTVSDTSSGANTFVQAVAFTPDNVLPVQGNGFTVLSDIPYFCHMIGIGAHIVHTRAQAVSMLPYPYMTVSPNNRGSAAESPVRLLDLSMTPMPLRVTEEFDVFVTQNSGGTETEYVLVNWCDGPPAPLTFQLMPGGVPTGVPQVGRAFSVHWTASTTLTAAGWSQVAPVFDQTLPAGSYALIGMRAYSATALFARMFPLMLSNRRPGGVGVRAYDSMDPWFQRAWPITGGKVVAPMGVWMSFYQNVPPNVEFFATSADTAEEGWFDLVYLGPQTIPGA
jgi:hypothetical protein